jgi:lysophospholipid acyltransferase (LPLAT)-like uncharacterized protein
MARERARWTFAVVGFLGAWLLRLFRLTWRVREEPPRFVAARRAELPGPPGTIYVHWHSRIVLAAATQSGLGVRVMVSRHGDGEYITRVIEKLGFVTARGSTTRGGARALLEVVRTLREGDDVAFTPDGPRGPRLVVQPGCVAAASKARAAIVPIGFDCRSARRLRSWDRFVVPWPFTRVAVVAGDPIVVPPDLDDAGVALWCGRVQAALLDATRRAAESAGVTPESPDVDPLTGRPPETAAPRAG